MAAPSFVQAGTGVADIAGPWTASLAGVTNGNLIVLHQYMDGTSSLVGIDTMTNAVRLDGAADALTGITCDVGSPAVGRMYIGFGRATASGTVTMNGDTTGSDDVFARIYEFQDVHSGSYLTDIMERFHSDPEYTIALPAAGGTYFGNATNDMASDGTYWIAVSTTGEIAVSTDSYFVNDTKFDVPGFNTLNAIATDGAGTWVTVGGSGYMVYCTGDPTVSGNWTQNTGAGSSTFNDVSYGNGYWVAVGGGGVLYYAVDPTGAWTSNTQGASNWNSVRYGNGYWLTVGDSGALRYRATDPTGAWTSNAQGASRYVTCLYANGNWVIAGDAGALRYRATDPTGAFTSNAQGATNWNCLYYGGPNGNQWAMGGASGLIRYTTDPTGAWTVSNVSDLGSLTFTSITWDEDHWWGTFAAGASSSGFWMSAPFRRESGTTATVPDAVVTSGGPDRLAVNLISISDDNPISAFTGMTGGTWAEAVAEFASSTGNDGAIGIQTATLSSAGTINGGTFTQADATDGFGVLGFALIGTTVAVSVVLAQGHVDFSDPGVL